MEKQKQKQFRDKREIEYVTCVRYFDNGKSHKCQVKKSLTKDKQYMMENNLEIFIEPNSEEIKAKLEADRMALSGENKDGQQATNQNQK